MKHLKRVVCILAIVSFALVSVVLPAVAVESGNPQTKCPVMGGPINKNAYVDHDGKRIYFCCEACPKEFKKDPAKYMKKMEDEGVKPEASPAK